MNNLLLTFAVLQIADIITTIIFLSMGVKEANFIIRFLMEIFSPVWALVLVKLFGIGFGLIWYFRGLDLKKVNQGFFVLVLWNIVAIIKMNSMHAAK